MKLKFRADKEDLMIFLAFAIFLLYIIAVGIVNLSTFATEGHFAGFNPIPAFAPRYIGTTLGLYFLAVAGLFVSVSSSFFEREKGIGFTTDKKDKGYSRWAKDKEIQTASKVEKINIKDYKTEFAGTPLMYKGDNIWVDNGESHTLVIGATGSGKTQSVILPTVKVLAKKGESMIITDPKGEIYEKTSLMLRERGYQILLLNFRDPQNGNAWNPMSLPYKIYKEGNQDKAIELLDDLALNILYDESNKNADPFWEKTSADYFSGVALGLFEDAKEDEININSISLATTVGEEKFGGSTYIKEYFGAKDPASAAAINASSTIMAPTETKGSILSVFKQKVKLFASRDNLSEMLSHSDIDLESIGEKPTAVFIVIQDEKKTYHSLVTILLKQIYETLIAVAQRHGGKLPVRTNFLLDEFANMPPLKDVTTMITAARSRQIRFTMIIQNFAQLDSVYGKEDAETLRGNCGNLIYLVTTELKALEEISKMCGEVKSKKDDKTASTPLVTVSDLQRMKENDVIILRLRTQPFKTHFTPDWQLDWGKKYPIATYPTREKQPVHTFDIKEFVKNQKKKKLLEMMNAAEEGNKDSGMPSGGMRPPIPMDFMRQAQETRPQQDERKVPSFLTREDPIKEERKAIPERKQIVPTEVSPFGPPMPNKQQPKSKIDDDLGFDVDELVKKIDAKIAELEAEERRNKEAEEAKKAANKQLPTVEEKTKVPTTIINNFVEKEPVQRIEEKTITTAPVIKTEQVKPVEEVPVIQQQETKTQTNLNLDDLDDDDDFFDDFFDN